MPRLELDLECPVHRDFRVDQIAGMFDVDLKEKATTHISVEAPDLDRDWRIGAIVGPSGSGKSSVARALGAKHLYQVDASTWPHDKAVISCFGDRSAKDVSKTLTAVGFSSPPAWVKPYHVLSNGEKFRCDLARALLSDGQVWFDEFTSLVDRTVAKVGSAAVAKQIRNGNLSAKFVAVTCHYDVIEWLQPDWTLDMATGAVAWGSLRRPEIPLEIVRCSGEAWHFFKKHHYMSAALHHSSTCYMGLWEGVPVAFCAVIQQYGWKDFVRISRIVTLPDYQGVGVGTGMIAAIAADYRRQGKRCSITASNPAIVRHCEKSPLWVLMKGGVKRGGNNAQTQSKAAGSARAVSTGRAVVAFEFVGEPLGGSPSRSKPASPKPPSRPDVP